MCREHIVLYELFTIYRVVFNPAVSSPGYAISIACFARLCKLREWQHGKCEGATLVYFATHGYLTAVGLYNCPAEVQAKPGATYLSAVAVVAVKFVKNVRQYTGIYTEAEVFHAGFNHTVCI